MGNVSYTFHVHIQYHLYSDIYICVYVDIYADCLNINICTVEHPIISVINVHVPNMKWYYRQFSILLNLNKGKLKVLIYLCFYS